MEYTIDKIKKDIRKLIAEAVDVDFDIASLEITNPPTPEMGDLAVPCFYLAKLLKKAPNAIALELKDKILNQVQDDSLIKEVKSEGPYLNFVLDSGYLAEGVISQIKKSDDQYGELELSKSKVMIEFSQPNTHKEFHVGHVRNTVLGQCLVNLYREVGYDVVAVNYIGDIGSHVAKCLWALKKFHNDDKVPEEKAKWLGQIYSEASAKVEKNEEYKKEVAEVQQLLENGDKEWNKLWKETRKWSLGGFNQIYKTLGIKFDHIFYESEVEKPGKKIVRKLLDKGVAEKSQGAVIIDLDEYDLKQFLLLKSDGSSLYSTKDIALAELKFNKFKIDESLMVIDNRQSFYLKQLFKTLEVLGFNKKMVHVPYDFVTLKDGAMASRKGNVILFNDFYKELTESLAKETEERHSDWTDKKIRYVAEKIALAAIKFNMLKIGNDNVIVFDTKEATSFDGFSGPYILYTVSRINSIIKKVKVKGSNYDKLVEPIEKEIIMKVAGFTEVIKLAVKTNQPSEIAKYLFDLAKLFASFYQNISIMDSDNELKKARVAMVESVRVVLSNGLKLMGIETVDEM